MLRFSPPDFHAAIIFPVFFRITHDGLSERGTTRSLGVAVISNLTVCDVCVFHAAVFGEMKLFAVLGFFV